MKETIKTKTSWIANYKDGYIGLPLTAILENGESVEVKIDVWGGCKIATDGDCEITWEADGFNNAIAKFKKGWNNVARIFQCQPRIVKFNL